MTSANQTMQQQAESFCPDCGTPEDANGRFCPNCRHLKRAAPAVRSATFLRRLVAFLLDGLLVPLTLVIGYLVWWLIVLANGQTQGKQLVGIRAAKYDGEPLTWGPMFIREFLVKNLVIGFLSGITGGIVFAVNYLLPLFDKDGQALHDKMVETVVIRDA